jgi:hypothetical protein
MNCGSAVLLSYAKKKTVLCTRKLRHVPLVLVLVHWRMPGRSKLTGLGWVLSKAAPGPITQRPIPPLTVGTKRELPLSNPMRQLDSAERDGRLSSGRYVNGFQVEPQRSRDRRPS